MTLPISSCTPRAAAILLAKASITGAAVREMEELAQRTQESMGDRFAVVVHAFSEQGSPSLRDALSALASGALSEGSTLEEITIVPLLLPMEPGFRTWIAGAVQRWRQDAGGVDAPALPQVLLAAPPADHLAVDGLVRGLLDRTPTPITSPAAKATAGSVIPPQKSRVLVCRGGPCNHAGAGVVWGHLRNEQKRLDLRNTGDGMMSARTSCLGPCNLAPVVQVFPEGTWYGGVDEAGIDRIIDQHLLRGEVVAEIAYEPLLRKQTLRSVL